MPGGPYQYREDSYPQFGQYMIFCKMSTKDFYYKATNTNLGKAWESGVVGPEGIIMPAKYTGGIRVNTYSWFIADARITVFPSLKLISMARDIYPGKEDGARTGAVNFKGEVVMPFIHDYNAFSYVSSHNVFTASDRSKYGNPGTLYSATGKKLHSGSEYNNDTFINGYVSVEKSLPVSNDPGDGVTFVDGFVQVATGKEWLSEMIRYDRGLGYLAVYSSFSQLGTVWLRNKEGLWGLYHFGGKEIIQPKYTSVTRGDVWEGKENPNAAAELNGKVELICPDGSVYMSAVYKKVVRNLTNRYWLIRDANNKTGLYDSVAHKEVIKPQFDDIRILCDWLRRQNTL